MPTRSPGRLIIVHHHHQPFTPPPHHPLNPFLYPPPSPVSPADAVTVNGTAIAVGGQGGVNLVLITRGSIVQSSVLVPPEALATMTRAALETGQVRGELMIHLVLAHHVMWCCIQELSSLVQAERGRGG
jgi:hypothetical protein